MLNLKLMTSQPGWQTITTHTLPNISRIKDNQPMKFGQVIDYSCRNNFLQISCRKWGREASLDLVLFSKKDFYEVKELVCSLVSIYFDSPQLGVQ